MENNPKDQRKAQVGSGQGRLILVRVEQEKGLKLKLGFEVYAVQMYYMVGSLQYENQIKFLYLNNKSEKKNKVRNPEKMRKKTERKKKPVVSCLFLTLMYPLIPCFSLPSPSPSSHP